MNNKRKESKTWLLVVLALLVLAPVLFLLIKRMEGTPPQMRLELASTSLGTDQKLTLHVEDPQSGIRQVWVAVLQDGKESVLLDRFFPAGTLISGGAVRKETLSFPLNVETAGLKNGQAVLRMTTRDFSWRKWGKGNQVYQDQQVVIDTEPPQVEVLSHVHNLNQGGAGLVIYRLSETCPSSGVLVGDRFYPGMAGHFDDASIHMTFFALSHLQGPDTLIQVTATDSAGNQARAGLPYHINGRRFKHDKIPISDKFLNRKMPEFRTSVGAAPGETPLNTFLKVNGQLRRSNYESLIKVTAISDAQLYWQGPFLRLPNAANRAGFADNRTYLYEGKKIDEQTHLGIDLASVQQSPVPAGNSGKVVFAGMLGIYGETIVIDHGFGLFSMYSHLSHMDVKPDQMVNKGEIIAKTGATGLAGGDHLHFSILIYETFVNPLEWWDAQWIINNVTYKLDDLP